MADNTWEPVAAKINEAFSGVDFESIKGLVPEDSRAMINQIKTPGDLVGSWINAQKLVGKKAEDPDFNNPEIQAKIQKAWGVPEKPEEYTFEGVKADANALKALQETFANTKLTKKQAETVLKKFQEVEQAKNSQEETEYKNFTLGQIKERETRYGDKLEAANNLVEFAIEKAADGNEKFKEALAILKDDNNYFEMFRRMGEAFKGDNPNGPADKQPGGKTTSIKDEYQQYMDPRTDLGKLYLGGPGVDQDKQYKARARVQEIYKLAAAQNISLV